jgi:ATP-dependent DNA ligase I
VLLADLAEVSAVVRATRSRTAKSAAIAGALRAADPAEVETVVAYLSGELRQRRTGVGWKMLSTVADSADRPTLSVAAVDAAFAEISALAGAGSQTRRQELIRALFAATTPPEQQFVRGLVSGELRQGALDGVMLDAIARASGRPAAEIRRAAMLRGASGPVAVAALTDDPAALAAFSLDVGRPLRPMLASTAADIGEAFAKAAPSGGQVAVDWKLDGIRIQVHRDGGLVRIFTRSLDDITDRLPEIVETLLDVEARSFVVDGEAIALDEQGRPRPFQQTASRTASRVDVARLRVELPLTAFVFDILHLDGVDLIDRPGSERIAAMQRLLPAGLCVPRLVTDQSVEAIRFAADAVSRGHEGVVVKSLSAPYEAGRRGAAWVKVKPRHTLDLVVLAAEWGHGRRRGWLSNLHLGARDPETGGFVMLGKTFKGLTDELLTWQTEQLLALQVDGGDDFTVRVRPELVVEIAFDGIQTSTRYSGGMALRFARVIRYRDDKRIDEADTVETVRSIHAFQSGAAPEG